MRSILKPVKSPLTRAIIGASTILSLATLIFALWFGITESKEEKTNFKLGVYGSLFGAIAGAVVGGLTGYDAGKGSANKKSGVVASSQDNASQDKVWKDWRNFVVDRKVQESQEITSFYLKPQDQGELTDFKPGQFLTIKLDIPDQARPVIRTYSLSDYENGSGYYRLSIKKEGSPKGLDVPPGVASNFMHDQIHEGSVIPAKPPNGKFFIDINSSTPAVLISNGVGITPMISMAKAVIKTSSDRASANGVDRHVWFLHGARNGEYHAFREAMVDLEKQHPNLHIHYKYSRPRPEDEGHFHSQGYVDKDLIESQIIPQIQEISGSSNAEYFLCGSPKFMDSLRSGLSELGVAEDKVFFESFSKGGKTKGAAPSAPAGESTSGEVTQAEVVFAASGKMAIWSPDQGTLLDFAEVEGIDPPSSCRQGVCLTCMCELNEGEVDYLEPPTTEPDEGNVLICICRPKTNKIVLNL